MGERRALVIASQCDSLNLLSFLPEAARDVADALLDPEVGGCVPALADGRRMLVDPTAVELDDAVVAAFERAHEDEATLFLALVGHGDYADDDFYFLTRDGTSPPDSRRSFHLAQRVKELLGRYSLLDGLVILLDTCHAGVAASQAAARWIEIVGKAGKRFEVLTASDERTAADGCFSRSLASILRSGRPELGERLRCADLKRVIAGFCPTQTAVHLAFDGVRAVEKGDQGLWLAVNASDAWQPLRGNPSAAEIERLTEGYRPIPGLSTVVGHLLMGTRFVAVTGPDRETLVAALARPAVAPGVVPAKLLHAVLIVTAGHTAEQVAQELARQLRQSVPGFAAASGEYTADFESTLDDVGAFERAVHGPLGILAEDWAGGQVVLALSGISRMDSRDRTRLIRVLTELAEDPTLRWVRVVVADPSAEFGPQVPVVTAERQPLWDYLAKEIDSDLEEDEDWHYPPLSYELSFEEDEEPLGPDEQLVLGLIHTAAVRGPLPITILAAAAGRPIPSLREILTRLDGEIVRAQAGTADETAGLPYPPERRYTTPAEAAKIAGAIAEAAPASGPQDTPEQRYAQASEAEMLWLAGQVDEAVRSLEERPLAVPVENRERWATWAIRVRERFGREHPLTIRVFARHGTWMGKSGDREGAFARFGELLPVAEQVLGAGDPEIFSIRNNLGFLLWELDRPAEAREAFRSLAEDAHNVLGPDHAETLHARHLRSVAEGKCGDGAESLRLARELLPEAERALGESHDLVLKIQHNILFWRTEIEAPPPDPQEHRRLLDLSRGTLGERHPDVLARWFTYALALAKHGQVAEALAEWNEELEVSQEVLGERHPQTRQIEEQLAHWG